MECPAVASRYHPSTASRLANRIMVRLIRFGLPVGPMALLTVAGRRSGQPRTTPVFIGVTEGQRWIISSWGQSEWVKNVRAAGTVMIRQGRHTTRYRATEQPPATTIAQVHESFRKTPGFLRGGYAVKPGASEAEFAREAQRHPVFYLSEPETI